MSELKDNESEERKHIEIKLDPTLVESKQNDSSKQIPTLWSKASLIPFHPFLTKKIIIKK